MGLPVRAQEVPQEAAGRPTQAPDSDEAGSADDAERDRADDVPDQRVVSGGPQGHGHRTRERGQHRRPQLREDHRLDLPARGRRARIERDGPAEAAQRRLPLVRPLVQPGDAQVGGGVLRIDLESEQEGPAGLVETPVRLVDRAAGEMDHRGVRCELPGAFDRRHRGGRIDIEQGFGEAHVVDRRVRCQPHRGGGRLDRIGRPAGEVQRERQRPEAVAVLRGGGDGRAGGRDRRVVLAELSQAHRAQIQCPDVVRFHRENAVEHVQGLAAAAEPVQLVRAHQVLMSRARHSSRFFFI